ncbi:MAG: ABC transporter ATP-binding protein [Gammaproteobacteria bacterium]|nr:ABC transporter ATP-binding protein [Gammaproteobacteria bacterium]
MTQQAAGQSLLRLSGITKRFNEIAANDGVDFEIVPGEIHALVGENGAGKSTLVKMIYGLLQPDEGEIHWRGQAVAVANPKAARALGVGMVFQHFSLFEALTAAENIAMAMDGKVDLATLAEEAQALAEKFGLPLDANAMVGDLSVGERQRIEIIRCLLQKPALLILDEPTSVLTPQEADRMFETLAQLKQEGTSVLYISHRLDEVRRLCDRATILRGGKVVTQCVPAEESVESLAAMMVGEQVHTAQREGSAIKGERRMQIRNLNYKPLNPFGVSLKNITLDLHAGVVVGIAGVAGNGQSELFECMSGEVLVEPKAILLGDTPVGQLGINARRKLGSAFCPEERNGHAAVGELSLSQNLYLSRQSTDSVLSGAAGVIDLSALSRVTQSVIQEMDVRKTAEDPPAASLSGGNLQKFLMGRELSRNPQLLIINQPTWGVDAMAAAHIRKAIMALAKSGSAVLVISQDLDELFEISDYLAVLHDGHLSNVMPTEQCTFSTIGVLMGGASEDVA